MRRLGSIALWSAVSVLGAVAFGVLALSRGETVSAAWLLTAAVCTYVVGYRFYSKFLAQRVFGLDGRRATPAERYNNGRDFVPTNKYVLFGHHFAAIAGAGPLVGPVLAAQFGFLPGTLWLVIGVVVAGAVQAGLLRGDARVIKRCVLGAMNLTVQWYKPGGRLAPAAFIDAMLQAALPALPAGAGRWPVEPSRAA